MKNSNSVADGISQILLTARATNLFRIMAMMYLKETIFWIETKAIEFD
jgi:hypothetical protein